MTTNELHELAKKIAPLIGYEYLMNDNVEPTATLDHLRSSARLRHAENKGAIYLSTIDYGASKGRIHVAVSWPTAGAELGWRTFTVSSYRRNDRTSEITVSGLKTPEQIAKDIKGRLLPGAESLYQEAQREMDDALSYKNGRYQTISKLAGLLGEKLSPPDRYQDNHDVSFWIDKGRYLGSAKVVGEKDVGFSFTVGIDKAEKVIEFIKSLEAK